jgi:hypothetical protein
VKGKSEYKRVLEKPLWPAELKTVHNGGTYARLQDDCEGEYHDPAQKLCVQFTPDGDAWVSIGRGGLRFRTYGGGGRSLRTRQALVILAEAIRLDELERPDPKP